MTASTLYECRNCLEHLRVALSQVGYPLRCPVCGRDQWRVVPAPTVEEQP